MVDSYDVSRTFMHELLWTRNRRSGRRRTVVGFLVNKKIEFVAGR